MAKVSWDFFAFTRTGSHDQFTIQVKMLRYDWTPASSKWGLTVRTRFYENYGCALLKIGLYFARKCGGNAACDTQEDAVT